MNKEGQTIKAENGDALEFIDIVNTLMKNFVFQHSIKEIVFVKIKNWFDHKWLNYSGKTVVDYDFGGLKGFTDAALNSVWRDKISIPPFNPNRVIYSKFIIQVNTGNKKIKKAIHRYRSSNANIHNRIEEYTSDGLVVWFSSNTETNGSGSIMMYRVQDDQVHTWYATVENKDGWKITKAKGIDLDKLKAYLH